MRDVIGTRCDPYTNLLLKGTEYHPWEKGDVVWNSAPTPGGPIAWVCTAAGTNGKLLGAMGTVDVLDPTKVVVNAVPDNLLQWAYVKIAASAKIFQIINDPTHSVPPNTLMLDTAATPGATGAITFQPATFSTVGVVENVGKSTAYLGHAARRRGSVRHGDRDRKDHHAPRIASGRADALD